MANAVLLLLSAVGSAGEMTPLLPTAPKSPAQLALLLQWAALVGFFGDALCGDFFLLYVQGGAIGVSREHYGASQWLCLTALMLSTQGDFNQLTSGQMLPPSKVQAAAGVAPLSMQSAIASKSAYTLSMLKSRKVHVQLRLP